MFSLPRARSSYSSQVPCPPEWIQVRHLWKACDGIIIIVGGSACVYEVCRPGISDRVNGPSHSSNPVEPTSQHSLNPAIGLSSLIDRLSCTRVSPPTR